MNRLTEQEMDLAYAWSDYKATYGIPPGIDTEVAYKLYRAGWEDFRDEVTASGVLR